MESELTEKINSVLEDYHKLFGANNLNLSQDLVQAEKDLQVLSDLKEKERKSKKPLESGNKLEEYDTFIEAKRQSSKAVTITNDMLLVNEPSQPTENSETNKLTQLELMAAERDMKRRRQKFKGGKTHTANKSYTEVMREVISGQMELLTSLMNEDRGDGGNTSHLDTIRAGAR